MNRYLKRLWSSLGAATLILLLCTTWAAAPPNHQISDAMAADQPLGGAATALAQAADEKPAYNGSTGCRLCHRQFEGRTFAVRMNESDTWSMRDRHSKAYELLKGDRGQEMGKRLGYADVTNDQRCLSCHADWQTDLRSKPKQDMLADGVGCEACHGASEKYESPHYHESWHEISLADRRTRYGMVNIRDPQVRAEVCLSCHVGNAEQGKVVTHDMYAAGHPPLPGFELGDFCELMPPHWDEFHEQLKKLEKASDTRKYLENLQRQLGQDESTLPGLKSVLVGAAIELRQSTKLVADQAAGKVRHAGDAPASAVWPEFALYDCTMCHHELQYPGWRQKRITMATMAPGRPLIPRWPQALISVAIDQISGPDRTTAAQKKKQFAKLLDGLDEPFRRQPFADQAEIAGPAQKLTEFVDHEVLDPLKISKFDQHASAAALRQLCIAASENVADYDSARQLAWAFDRVYEEYKQSAAGGQLINPAWKAVDDELAALKAELRLEMNSHRNAAKDVPIVALKPEDLQDAINHSARYSPTRFQQHFQTINAELAKLVQ
jgi:Cytochrome c554 and c-prime